MEKPKKCPFCGCDRPIVKRTMENWRYVQCRNGRCLARTANWQSEPSAVDAWNKRVTEEGDTDGN